MEERGDRVALDVEALYRRYGPMVLRRSRSILGDEAEALDAMQDVFVQVLRRRQTLRDDYPASLLYRIATNTSLNRLRSRRRSRCVAGSDAISEMAGSDDPAERAVGRTLLDQVFRGEKEGTRAIAEARWVEGAPLEETARRSGLSVSGVRKRLRTLRSRGLELLSH